MHKTVQSEIYSNVFAEETTIKSRYMNHGNSDNFYFVNSGGYGSVDRDGECF